MKALDLLFNERDFKTAAHYWTFDHIQHSANIASGRVDLFNLVKSLPSETQHKDGMIVAEGDVVMVHGRYGNPQGRSLVMVGMMRMQDSIFQEHWNAIQEEATIERSKSGPPLFGDRIRA